MKKFIATAAALCFLAAGCGQYDPLTEEQDIPEAVEATTGDTTETTTEPDAAEETAEVTDS